MIYTLKCKGEGCSHKFDQIMKLKEFESWKKGELKIGCPKCKRTDLEVVIGEVPVHFVGKGFTRRSA